MSHSFLKAAALSLAITFCQVSIFANDKPSIQPMSDQQRNLARVMLKNTIDKVKKHYYDTAYHGLDLDLRLKQADEKIRESQTLSDAFGVIAWALDGLNDSHTFFEPPPRPFDVENGWETTFTGDKCFITAVKPGSNADQQGIKPGDQVVAMEGFALTRDNLWKMQYAFNSLAPRSAFHLVLATPDGQTRNLLVKASVHQQPKVLEFTRDIWDLVRQQESYDREMRWRGIELPGDVLVWKLPAFLGEGSDIDGLIARARKHKALVMDLRGNFGGSEDLLTHLLSGLFENGFTLGEHVSRGEHKPIVIKGQGGHAFTGTLVVLIDSASASAAEIFARAIQLQKRGTVIGDRSSGKVMVAQIFPMDQGLDTSLPYGVEVTVADLLLSDGKSLEHQGVQPDEVLLPSGQDLATGRDPQLARAIALAGGSTTAEQAGTLFPVIWRRKD
jgi:C-terminal processing protease CtpA/Prc